MEAPFSAGEGIGYMHGGVFLKLRQQVKVQQVKVYMGIFTD
jgi:hypothetical protein